MRRLIARGFTILEMVIVLVLMSIAASAVIMMVANVGANQTENTDMQVGTQLLQECGEWIVSNHRRDENFYTSSLISSTTCYGLTTYSGFNIPSVTVTDPYTGAGCPAGGTCKLASISITKSSATLQPLNLVLVRYNPL
jgi:prepilin-type N-terminal cleavage/methylation domain-containing protein